ncbi:glycosyltransferase family 4 protein [Azorhizobium doebereinerae]|uniref:glycosyltransferase family 4 protein n=1 Tax=Azorhizobium doebereinerae TaxID=281091 RepID=UPI00048E4C4E|nr:glycosyltransferase [Azorhizobium doebereinerae]
MAMTSWIRRGTGIVDGLLRRANMPSEAETQLQLALDEAVSSAREREQRLLAQIERRAQLAVAEAKAFMEERASAGRHDVEQQIQAAVAAALAEVEAQLKAVREQVPGVSDRAPRVGSPSPVPAPAPYVAAGGRVLAAANWSPPLSWTIDASGTEVVARELARALIELGHAVSVGRDVLASAPAPLSRFPFATVSGDGADRRVLLGFDWADAGLPLEIGDWLEENISAVACVSTHAERLLIDQGCLLPVATIGFGIDAWERVEQDATYRVLGKGFRFLHVSACGVEQGLDALLDAFGRVFSDDDDVSLLIYATGAMPEALVSDIAERRRFNPAYPDVVVIADTLTPGQLKALYSQCHVFAAPARASGFGPEIAQAFLSGLPVVATAWGGHLDYCSPENSWLVDYAFTSGQSPVGVLAAVWAEPLAKGLDQALWLAYRADPAERFTRAWIGRKTLVEHYTWKGAAQRLARLAAAPDAGSREPFRLPTIGFVTSWNSKCGIASYVGHLLEPVSPTDVVIFADKNSVPLGPDGRNCVRTWIQGPLSQNGLETILPHLSPCGVEALVIQANFGFYSPADFAQLIDRVLALGIVVLVELHSTIGPPPDVAAVKLADYAPALRRCHRVLAHSPGDMNRLKAVGVVDNVLLFPLGIVVAPADVSKRPPVPDTPLLASFGFALPGKGLVELVHAVGILKQDGHAVRLRMLNSEHPNMLSAPEIATIRATIEQLGLQDDIELRTEYLPDEDCLALLGEADLVVNPYQRTSESSSAAVRFGLASRAPVLVTPLTIFDELGSAVFRTAGTSPRQMADGIASALQDLVHDTPAAVQVRAAARQWSEQHDVHRQGRRLMHMARALAKAQRRDQ